MNLNEFLTKFKAFNFSDDIISTREISTDEIVGISFFAASKYLQNPNNLMILAPTLFVAEQIRNELYSLVGKENIIFIPAEELVMVEYAAASSDILSDRIYGLYDALKAKNKILVTNVAAASRYYPKKELFLKNIFTLKVGDKVDIQELKSNLINIGYEVVNKVSKSGQCAFRGSIIDIYSLNLEDPIRIDLFDDEIDEMHNFKISTQESYNDIKEAEIIPFTDQLYTKDELLSAKEKILNQLNLDLNEEYNPELKGNIELDIEEILSLNKESKYYKYFSFISNEKDSLIDYFDCRTLIFSNNFEVLEQGDVLQKDANEFLFDLKNKGKCISQLELFNPNWVEKYQLNKVINTDFYAATKFDVRTPTFVYQNITGVKNSLNSYLENGYKIYMSFSSEQQKIYFIENYLKEIYTDKELLKLLDSKLFLGTDALVLGFEIVDKKLVALSQREIFGYKSGTNKFISKFKQATILKSYTELHPGDYVVHEEYGIGIFEGIKQITTLGTTHDYIDILYADEQRLHVPLDQFKLVRKYVSKEGKAPTLNRLFNDKWKKTKEKIKKKINLLAEKLSDLYRTQLTIKGYQFPEDDEFQKSFENDFEFELTPDQFDAINDIKKDMESTYPMNRLVCGDVGFGKTEVAFRAAFKAINSGKQALILCPTTLLALQHYERAKIRFSKYDVKIACLTRFLSNKEFNNALKGIEDGTIHLIIGTHKALSNKLNFKDLGLYVIDEEQRFGVEQKEKIRMRFPAVDSLTLSATPIPRTLQTSLVGMKSLSIINTAPRNRAPIQTYLIEHDDKIIYDLIKRELGRKGQVYYLHNDIPSLDKVVDGIRENCKNATVAYIHGQMDKDIIDSIMNDFYVGNIQVLVATTIIENGIDVANANLIIVENADKFGLAQLYQIKGRVGRSDKLAYAYLTYRSQKHMTDDAKKRLQSIKEFTELGSGYKIAQRDLMIRGAGDILGPEQAGFIDDVGVDLYIKLLNEAMDEQRGKKKEESKYSYVGLNYNAYIPNKFTSEENKFEIYELINDANSIQELTKAEAKIIDEFGKIPAELKRIIEVKYLKIILNNDLIKDFEEFSDFIIITFHEKLSYVRAIGTDIMEIVYAKNTSLSFIQGHIKLRLTKIDNWVKQVIDIINKITTLYNSKKDETR